MEEGKYIEILGQKLPTNLSTVAFVLIVASTLLGFHWLTLHYTTTEGANFEFHGGPYVYHVDGRHVTEIARQRLLIFWTPSKRTTLEMKSNGEKVEPWYDVDNDEKRINEFSNKLVELGAQGFNRFEVWGKGTTAEKWGYLWRLTADAGNVNFRRENFAKFYSDFWGRKKDIYIEEYDFTQLTR